ncbi:hypothetical protein H5410_050498 [Solanum commersonii]|uniref:Uncharacterized protein n=1 Tax=Solanum commersonii TaxID=4109 RepID=A0A9J5WWY5_SOLCO|nr:hypothetical protein H5410_050498 [Solanum commersonii]
MRPFLILVSMPEVLGFSSAHSCLLRLHMTKGDNIIKGDSFKYKGRSTKIVHPYLTPTGETKQSYMATLKPFKDESKDTIIDVLKANLKGFIVLNSIIENEKDEILGELKENGRRGLVEQKNEKNKASDLIAIDEDYTTPIEDEDCTAIDVDEIFPLAIVDENLVA